MARVEHSSTRLLDARTLVAGGDSSLLFDEAETLATCELYDPTSGGWKATGSLRSARTFHTATLLMDGRVLAVAGSNDGGPVLEEEIYEPGAGTWSSAGHLANPRVFHTATLLLDGKVLVTGGAGEDGLLRSCEIFDPTGRQWARTGDLSLPRTIHSATLLDDGRVLVVGGVNASFEPIASAELFNPSLLDSIDSSDGEEKCYG